MILDVNLSPPPPALSQEQLVQFRDPVRRFVGARVRNDAVADDLTQEIFIRVLKQLRPPTHDSASNDPPSMGRRSADETALMTGPFGDA